MVDVDISKQVAARIADEMDVRLGELVGYHYKGSDRTNATKTRIVVETDGQSLVISFVLHTHSAQVHCCRRQRRTRR